MKANFVIFIFIVIFEVCFSGVFDEKNDAIKEINVRVNEVLILQKNILQSAKNEKNQINSAAENELAKYLNLKVNETRNQLERDSDAVIRTAIVQGKPVTVIYCIRNVSSVWNNNITQTNAVYLNNVLEIKIKKITKIEFDEYVAAAITKGLQELAEQAKVKIAENPNSIQAIKREALNNCESAALLLGEIEVWLHEPILSREYAKMRQEIDKNFKNIKTEFNKSFENCLK